MFGHHPVQYFQTACVESRLNLARIASKCSVIKNGKNLRPPSRSFEHEKERKNSHQNCDFYIENRVEGNWWCLSTRNIPDVKIGKISSQNKWSHVSPHTKVTTADMVLVSKQGTL